MTDAPITASSARSIFGFKPYLLGLLRKGVYDQLMRVSGRHRFRIALAVILCLLFQQVAMAAYACPLTRMPPKAAAMAEKCAGMGMEQVKKSPALCEKHCAPDLTVLVDHAAPNVPMLALPPVIFELAPVQSVARASLVSDIAVDRSDPPPRLRYCSLLI